MTDAAELTPEDQWALVKRMLASSHFQRSPRLREFLLYIADRTLSNHPEEITEQRIGVSVFQRPEHYSPGDDNIVRASARQLRLKIRDYFETEGKNEAWLIDIPKGSYVPVFRPSEPAGSSPAEPGGDKNGRPGRLRHWIYPGVAGIVPVIAAIAALCGCVVLWRENQLLRKHTVTSRSTPSLVSTLLLEPDKRLNVVVADSTLPLIQSLTGYKMTVEEYAGRKYVSQGWLFEKPRPEADQFWAVLTARQATSLAALNTVVRLFRSSPEIADRIAVTHPRDLNARALGSDNFLFVGGSPANPWVTTFEQNLNFQQEDAGDQAVFRNQAPKPGESASYVSTTHHGMTGIAYARIALLPNPPGASRVMQLSGTSGVGVEAAGEFALSAGAVPQIQKLFGVSDLWRAEYFELLLEISSVQGAPRNVRVITHRVRLGKTR